MDTPSTQQPDLESRFDEAVLALLRRAVFVAKVSATELLKRAQTDGGLAVARKQLADHFGLWRIPLLPRYFQALCNRNRLDLSIEALATSPPWLGLFTMEEGERALKRLQENGYCPPSNLLTGAAEEEVGSPLLFLPPERGWAGFSLLLEPNLCDAISTVAANLAQGYPLCAMASHRQHLGECAKCRSNHPQVLEAYLERDGAFIKPLHLLLQQLKVCLHLEAPQDRPLVLYDLPPELGEDPEAFAEELDNSTHRARDLLARRAVMLAAFIGLGMHEYGATHQSSGDLWRDWRHDKQHEPVARFVAQLDEDLYACLLIARNVQRVISSLDGGTTLNLPSDGDLAPVPGVLYVEDTEDPDEWEELLELVPKQVHCTNLVYLAYLGALQQSGDQSQMRTEQAPLAQLAQQLSDLKDKVESNSALQVPILDTLERILSTLGKGSRTQAEESLRNILGEIYGKLDPQVRSCLLAAEQVFQQPDFANPELGVVALAQAFEIQLKRVLGSYIRRCGLRTLGNVRQAFLDQDPALAQFCRDRGLDFDALRTAVEQVWPYRNRAVHDPKLAPWQIAECREKLLGVKDHGGVFRPLVRILA